MKNDQEIIRTINKHLNLFAVSRDLTGDEVMRLHELLEETKLCFSGEFTGFHLLEDPDSDEVTDCAHYLTSLEVGEWTKRPVEVMVDLDSVED